MSRWYVLYNKDDEPIACGYRQFTALPTQRVEALTELDLNIEKKVKERSTGESLTDKWYVRRDGEGKAIEAGFVKYEGVTEDDTHNGPQEDIIAEIKKNTKSTITDELKTLDPENPQEGDLAAVIRFLKNKYIRDA